MSNAHEHQFDVLVIGSGEGGKYLAWHLARSGFRTAGPSGSHCWGSGPTVANRRSLVIRSTRLRRVRKLLTQVAQGAYYSVLRALRNGVKTVLNSVGPCV